MTEALLDIYRRAVSQRLSRFELARVIGARALQLSMGAPPLIDVSNIEVRDPVYIATLELINGLLPMSILRPRETGEYELVPVSKLVTPEVKRYLSSILESWNISRRV
ncbi:MAG: DNA-directed RNA polymerase subunit K [Desulfurococcaceae archaeon]